MVDRRVSWSAPARSVKCFDRLNPKSLSVHPLQSDLFMTGTNKGGVFIFDLRQDSRPVSELRGHTRSLSSCVFSRVSGAQVATLASDDMLRLYNTSTINTVIMPQCSGTKLSYCTEKEMLNTNITISYNLATQE